MEIFDKQESFDFEIEKMLIVLAIELKNKNGERFNSS